MAACGIQESEMVYLILNPKSKKPIGEKTLRTHFRAELDSGMVNANVKVVMGLYKNCITPTPQNPGGNPIAQMFWAKARLGWKDRQSLGLPMPEQPPEMIEDEEQTETTYEFARRIAFTLDAAGRKPAHKPTTITVPKKRTTV